jgi:hypothetical protein
MSSAFVCRTGKIPARYDRKYKIRHELMNEPKRVRGNLWQKGKFSSKKYAAELSY